MRNELSTATTTSHSFLSPRRFSTCSSVGLNKTANAPGTASIALLTPFLLLVPPHHAVRTSCGPDLDDGASAENDAAPTLSTIASAFRHELSPDATRGRNAAQFC